MSKRLPTPQPLRPTTFGQWLCVTFHRHPVTFIPHWDAIEPLDPPTIDVAATWRELSELIDRMAAAGALDDAHGDLVDRLVAPITDRWRLEVRQQHLERLRVIELLEAQGDQHRTRVGHHLSGLRGELDRLTDLHTTTWNSLVGRAPGTSPKQSGAAQALPEPLRPPTPLPTADADETPAIHRAA